MLIDVVDSHDVPVGVVARGYVFADRVNFRVVHDLVFNSRGNLLIQKLAPTHPRHPGLWGSSVAGYIFAGESYESAAARRLKQELGINAPLDYIGKTTMNDEGCEKFIAVFTAIHDGPFEFDTEHIKELEFLPISRIHELHATRARTFTPTFLRVLDFYQSRM
jgi:isopentenyldiphosphate isomerase